MGGTVSRFCESGDSMWVAQWTKALLTVVEARSITSTWSCIGKFGQGEAESKLSQIANLQSLHQHSFKSYT